MASGTVYVNGVAFQYFTHNDKVIVSYLPPIKEGKEPQPGTTLNVSIPYNKERGTNLRSIIVSKLIADKAVSKLIKEVTAEGEEDADQDEDNN